MNLVLVSTELLGHKRDLLREKEKSPLSASWDTPQPIL